MNKSDTNDIKLTENSQSVISHLNILQGIIQRMAGNSGSCKTWCITLVSAILILVADKNKPQFTLIAVIPTLLFFSLDTYYLALEKGFRDTYTSFIKKLHSAQITTGDLFTIKRTGKLPCLLLQSAVSFSVWPFYFTLLLMIYLTKVLVL
ncbi:MAG: hypothetical protein V1773_15910 [bacterium]